LVASQGGSKRRIVAEHAEKEKYYPSTEAAPSFFSKGRKASTFIFKR
jgi:hypothetical protein